MAWTPRNSGSLYNLQGVTYGNGTFVAVGWGNAITSPDGVGWTSRASGTGNGVTYGNDTFVAVGGGGWVLTSTDGVMWTPSSVTVYTLNGVTYGNGTFVAVGDFGTILSSSDGAVWTPRASGTYYNLGGVTYGNGTFVAVGWFGTILTSPDGVAWTPRVSGTGYNLNGVTCGGDDFVAVGDSGTLLTSPDGMAWTPRNSGSFNNLTGVAYGRGTFVAVGEGRAILQSDPLGVDLSVTPTGVSFGPVLKDASSDQTINVKNTGGGPLTISTIGLPAAPFSIVGGTCAAPQVLQIDESCTIIARFSPTAYGPASSSFTITSTDPDESSVTVQLSGKGGTPHITVVSTTTDFGRVLEGFYVDQSVIIRNDESATCPLTVSGIGSPAAPFTIVGGDCTVPKDLAIGGSCTIQVRFSPIWYGAASSSFTITSDDPAEGSVSVSLSGNGLLLLAEPDEGTLGTAVTISGSNFGAKKGKLLVGTLALTVLQWNNGFIKALITKPIDPDTYDVTIQPSGPKGTPAIVERNAFTVRPAEIDSIDQGLGSAYDQVTVKGKFFGTKKGKVYLEYEEGGQVLKKSCSVTKWWMDPVTNESEIIFAVPKMSPEVCDVVVDVLSPLPDAEEKDGFTVKAPAINSVQPGSGSVGERITISGNYFGSRKPSVYLGYLSKGKPTKKICSVLAWGDDEIFFAVPKVPAGTYDVIVTNSVSSQVLTRGFVIK
jgi:hypothetical protein